MINITKMGLERAKQDLQESQRETESYERRSEAAHPDFQPHSTSQNEEASEDTSEDTQFLLVIHHNHNSDFVEEDAVLGAEDDRPQNQHEKPVDSNLVFELDHVEDILRTMAESLRTEQEERVRADEAESVNNEDTAHTQPSAAGWSGGRILM